jgi:threonine dehydrogenase-like Zn-dependent dehydrogenase
MNPLTAGNVAAVLSAPRKLEVRPVPAGPLPAAGAWLEVEACGICGSDWSWYAEREIPAPFVPGHEMVGRIAAAWGEHGNTGFVPGARVAVEEALPCWSCPQCRSGRHRLCPRSTRYGGTALDVAPALWGGFSRYTYLDPRTSVHRVPESLDASLATLFIPVSNGLSWLRAAGRLLPGESVVVLGVGQHGLASVAAARRCGAGTVAAVGRSGDQARLDAAATLGADLVLDSDQADWAAAVLETTGQRGADLLVDTTPGATGILQAALKCAAVGGRVIVAGLKHGASSPLPTDVLVRREIQVRGVAARESWAIDAALSWIEADPALFGGFSSVTVGLADVEQALLALGGEGSGLRPVHAVVEPQRLTRRDPSSSRQTMPAADLEQQ